MTEAEKKQLRSQTWRREIDDAEYDGLGLLAMQRCWKDAESIITKSNVGSQLFVPAVAGTYVAYRRIR